MECPSNDNPSAYLATDSGVIFIFSSWMAQIASSAATSHRVRPRIIHTTVVGILFPKICVVHYNRHYIIKTQILYKVGRCQERLVARLADSIP